MLEWEKGASTSAQFQKLLPHNQDSNTSRVKQEQAFSIQLSRRKRNGPQNQANRQNNQGNQGNKLCYFCGNLFSLDHRKSCPAREVKCNLCKKRGHFAKCCNSSKRRVNLVQEEQELPSHSVDCNFLDVDYDSESEYCVFQLEDIGLINIIEMLKPAGGKPGSLSIQLRQVLVFLFHMIQEAQSRSSTNVFSTFYYNEVHSFFFGSLQGTQSKQLMWIIINVPTAYWARSLFLSLLMVGKLKMLLFSFLKTGHAIFWVWNSMRSW